MSALALVAAEWGAQVAGSDRARSTFVDRLEEAGIPVTIGHARENVPDGWEVIVSSAIAAENPELVGSMRSRGELLAELVDLRPSIVVAGAHGKTTTAAMIAYALDQAGRDPAFLIGGTVPQLGANGRVGEGWLVAEGDESDRSLMHLRPDIAVLTNIELDHHATFASRAEVEELYDEWLDQLKPDAHVVRGDALAVPDDLALSVPGEHNRKNAAAAIVALEHAGVDTTAAIAYLTDFEGAGRRFEARGEAAGVRVFDDYAHHPTEIAATLEAARTVADGGRIIVLFQPHLYSRTQYLTREFAVSLSSADAVVLTDVYAAREPTVEGITGKIVVDELSTVRPGMRIGWAPAIEDAVELASSVAREGDLILTVGAGDIDRAVPLLLERLSS